ncbi:hypothetical protein PSSHI_47490 [Photobacterium sp. R1]
MAPKSKTRVYSEPLPMRKPSKGTGFKAAKACAAIGARFGPCGIIAGGILGYIAGELVDEMLED